MMRMMTIMTMIMMMIIMMIIIMTIIVVIIMMMIMMMMMMMILISQKFQPTITWRREDGEKLRLCPKENPRSVVGTFVDDDDQRYKLHLDVDMYVGHHELEDVIEFVSPLKVPEQGGEEKLEDNCQEGDDRDREMIIETTMLMLFGVRNMSSARIEAVVDNVTNATTIPIIATTLMVFSSSVDEFVGESLTLRNINRFQSGNYLCIGKGWVAGPEVPKIQTLPGWGV